MSKNNNEVGLALNILKELLNDIIKSNSSNKSSLIQKFENQVNIYWKDNKKFFGQSADSVLADLISDLAYYQPNPIIRLGDKSLFDNKKLVVLINDALKKLEG